MTRKTLLFVTCLTLIADEHPSVSAFRRHDHEASDEKIHNTGSTRFFRPRHATVDSQAHDNTSYKRPSRFLNLLTGVAHNGASMWSNHISEGAASFNNRTRGSKVKDKRRPTSSPLHVSKLHHQIQNQSPLNIDRMNDNDEHRKKRPSTWPKHFFEDTLAYIAGGAAATSAFDAVIVGTIFATVVVTVGAVFSAFIFGDDDWYWEEDVMDNVYSENGGQNLESEGCDLDDAFLEVVSSNSAKVDHSAFDESTLLELKKCHAGKPFTDVTFIPEQSPLTCSRELPQYESGGFGVDPDFSSFLHENNQMSSHDFTEEHQFQTPESKEEQPKVIELIWHDSYSTAINSYYTTNTNNKRRRRNKPKQKLPVPDPSFDLEETERDGAILLSDTFRVTSSAFGLLADAVRFAGESTAATAGGTARLVGGAVKAGGWAVGSLGTAISTHDKKGSSIGTDSGKKRERTRHIAGGSVKLLGDAIDNVAESLLLAGSATERVAFAAAGAAEGAVRIAQDFTLSLSSVFAREGRKGVVSSIPSSRIMVETNPSEIVMYDDGSAGISEPNHDSLSINTNDEDGVESNHSTDDMSKEDFVQELSIYASLLSSWVIQNLDYIMKDTVGVSSPAPQLLLVLIILFSASVMLLATNGKDQKPVTDKMDVHHEKNIDQTETKRKTVPDGITAGDGDSHSTLTVDSTMKRDPVARRTSKGTGATHYLFCAIILPFRLIRILSVRVYHIIFNKKMVLFIIHLLGWAFISQISQNRSAAVARKAKLAGLKNAIESVGQLNQMNQVESAFWLNAIIHSVWRVESPASSDVGGLEPLLASSVSSLLARSLEESYSRPSGVAHVSLASLTFGKSPPIFRGIDIKSVNTKEAQVYLGLDVVMLLEDAELMLDIKPSSLEYKMVPSTKVAINSFDLQVPLDLSIQASSVYPYISYVNISLSEVPDFSLRIVPQQESGLKGIDFGSFPLISKWVKEVINTSIVDYISPHYISINIPAWLKGWEQGEDIIYYG